MNEEISLKATVQATSKVLAKGEEYENKAVPKVKLVKIKIKPRRAVTNLGEPGDIVEVTEADAERLIAIGYAVKI